MIYQIKYEDETDYAQARNVLHLLQSYHSEIGVLMDIVEVREISEEEAKTIILSNSEYNENDPEDLKSFSLYDTVAGDDFVIVGSTAWL